MLHKNMRFFSTNKNFICKLTPMKRERTQKLPPVPQKNCKYNHKRKTFMINSNNTKERPL